MTNRGAYVHDLRHRYSLELRPDAALDARLRAVAVELEAAGLMPTGAAQQPRFHPHVTVLRGARAVDLVLGVDVGTGAVTFDRAGTFGHGRILWIAPADDTSLRLLRDRAAATLDPTEVDPLVTARAWTPHLTLAYAVPEPSRAAALERVQSTLPITGRWGSLEAWDLDVRPTVRVARIVVPPVG